MTFSNNFKPDINNESIMSFEKDEEREKELNKLVNKFNIDNNNNNNSNNDMENKFDNNNNIKTKPLAVFSNNFDMKIDKDMNEELRALAKQTNETDNLNDNNIILNQSLRNQILNNNKSIITNTNISTQTAKSNGNKLSGKIYVSKK